MKFKKLLTMDFQNLPPIIWSMLHIVYFYMCYKYTWNVPIFALDGW